MSEAECLTAGTVETDIDGNCVTCGASNGEVCKIAASVNQQRPWTCLKQRGHQKPSKELRTLFAASIQHLTI